MSGTNLRWKSNTVDEILSNVKQEMDFYFTTSASPFPSSEITWMMKDEHLAIFEPFKAVFIFQNFKAYWPHLGQDFAFVHWLRN